MSDIDELTELLQENVSANDKVLGLQRRQCIRIMSLPWGETVSTALPSLMDIVFASDCLYDDKFFDVLLETIGSVTKPRGVIYFSYQVCHAAFGQS